MTDLAERLDAAVPAYEGSGDWTAVLRDAGVRTHTRRRTATRVAVVFAVLLLAAVAAVAWPSSGPAPSVVDRALAATGTGTVLHAVFESPDGQRTLVNLETGKQQVVRGTDEIWFDPNAGLRDRSVFEGVVQSDSSIAIDQLPAHARQVYGSLGAGYREALASGTAKVVGHGEVDGKPVYWIRLAPQHQVAVSHETFLPVEVRVGEGATAQTTRVLSYETLAPGDAPLDKKAGGIVLGGPLPQPGRKLTLDEATAILGRPAVLAGGSAPTTVRKLGDAVQLEYGTLDSMDYTALTEAAKPSASVTTLLGVRNYAPPEGTLLLAGSSGLLRSNGLVVAIHTGDPEQTLALARALTPAG